ncbi:hypothetical protein [Streptomyces sp. NPDC101150]|uniref:hypothetical protein n=1 Tax=Streptomyces sp. NPDC101150 TaxID=3366114 RepID=UPI00382375EA
MRVGAGAVQTLATAGDLQHDRRRELTYDALRTAEAKDNKSGRRPAATANKAATVHAAHLRGQPLARPGPHHVNRGPIHTAATDLMPDHTTPVHQDIPAREVAVTHNMPGKVAGFLCTANLDRPNGPRSTRA